MAVTTKINRKLDNDCVQIEITSKKTWTRYFKVPESKADSFCASYKKNDKKIKRMSTAAFVLSPFIGTIIALPFTKNLGRGARTGIGIAAGIASAIGSVFAMAPVIEKNNNKLLKKFDAEEIFYENKNFPI